MIVFDQEIKPGKNILVQIPVANLPSGTEINLKAHVFRSKKEGPTVLIIGGLHGDEINGVELVRRAVREKLFKKMNCGTVIAVPLLNVYGFINFSREFPDGKDVNRSFPGNGNGSLASRVAYTFTKYILPHADLIIDYHTGGKSIYNYPQARYTGEDPESYKLAKIFNMPCTIQSGLIPRSLRKTAFGNKIPILVFEGGESLRIDDFSIQEGIRGLKNVLIKKGMISGKLNRVKTIDCKDKTWVRANRSGVFILEKKSGEWVEKGDVLGRITDPYNSYQAKVTAKCTGFIFGHNNNPVVSKGDALFHIGY